MGRGNGENAQILDWKGIKWSKADIWAHSVSSCNQCHCQQPEEIIEFVTRQGYTYQDGNSGL